MSDRLGEKVTTMFDIYGRAINATVSHRVNDAETTDPAAGPLRTTILTIDAPNQVHTSTLGGLPLAVAANVTLAGNGAVEGGLKIDCANTAGWTVEQIFDAVDIPGTFDEMTIGSIDRISGWPLISNGNATLETGFLRMTDVLVQIVNEVENGNLAADIDAGESIDNPSLPLLEWLMADDDSLLPGALRAAIERQFAEPGIFEANYTRLNVHPVLTYMSPTSSEESAALIVNERLGDVSRMNASANGSVGSFFRIRDVADECSANPGTLLNGDPILLSFASDKVRDPEIRTVIHAEAPGADVDREIVYAVPAKTSVQSADAACTLLRSVKGEGFPTSSATASGTIDLTAATTTSSDGSVVVSGLVHTGVAAGDVRLQWAQGANLSSAGE